MVDLSSWVWPLIFFAVILGFTALIAWLAGLLIRSVMAQSSPQVRTAAQRLGVIVVWAVGIVLAVQELGVSVAVLLLVIGLLGIAAILALRLPLENFGAKFFSDVYTPFKLGDTVRVSGHSGKVIEINAMTTVLLSESDELIAIPNSRLLGEPVENLTPQAWKQLIVPITLSSSIDLPTFESNLLKSLAKFRLRLDPRFPPIFTTKTRSAESTDLALTVMVRRPEDREPMLAEVNRLLSEAVGKGGPPPERPPG